MDLSAFALSPPTSGLPLVLEWGSCTQPSHCPHVAGLHLFWSRQTSEPLLSGSASLGPGNHHTSAPSPLLPGPRLLPLTQPHSPGHSQYTQPRGSAQRETKVTAWFSWLWPAPSYRGWTLRTLIISQGKTSTQSTAPLASGNRGIRIQDLCHLNLGGQVDILVWEA